MTEKYNNLITNIQLDDIYLSKMESLSNKNYNGGTGLNLHLDFEVDEVKQDGVEITIPINFNVAPYFSETDENFSDVDENEILFQIRFTLDLKYILSIEEEEEILKSSQKEFNEEIEMFAKKNVPINAWPFARELVSNISTRMGFPPLLIPMYKNVPKY